MGSHAQWSCARGSHTMVMDLGLTHSGHDLGVHTQSGHGLGAHLQSGHGLGVHSQRLVMGYRVVNIGSAG